MAQRLGPPKFGRYADPKVTWLFEYRLRRAAERFNAGDKRYEADLEALYFLCNRDLISRDDIYWLWRGRCLTLRGMPDDEVERLIAEDQAFKIEEKRLIDQLIALRSQT